MHSGSEQVNVIGQDLVSDQKNTPLPTRCRPNQLDFVFVAGPAVMATFDGGAITLARIRIGQRWCDEYWAVQASVAQISALNASLRLDCFRFIAFGIARVKFRSDDEPCPEWGFSEWAASAWPCVICVTEERFDPAHIREVGWGRV